MALESSQLAQVAPELLPLVETIQPIVGAASVVVGGIFGLYIILLLVRVHYERKKVKLLEAIRYDLDQMNIHKGITYSRLRKGWFKRMLSFFRSRKHDKKMKRHHKKNENKRK